MKYNPIQWLTYILERDYLLQIDQGKIINFSISLKRSIQEWESSSLRHTCSAPWVAKIRSTSKDRNVVWLLKNSVGRFLSAGEISR